MFYLGAYRGGFFVNHVNTSSNSNIEDVNWNGYTNQTSNKRLLFYISHVI